MSRGQRVVHDSHVLAGHAGVPACRQLPQNETQRSDSGTVVFTRYIHMCRLTCRLDGMVRVRFFDAGLNILRFCSGSASSRRFLLCRRLLSSFFLFFFVSFFSSHFPSSFVLLLLSPSPYFPSSPLFLLPLLPLLVLLILLQCSLKTAVE